MVSRNENRLIESLYEAALGHQSWDEAGLQVAENLGGMTLMLSTHDPRGTAVDVVTTLGMSSRQIQEYGHFARHDLWALGAAEQKLFGKALTGSQIVDDRKLVQSYIYNEYLRQTFGACRLS